MSFDLTTGVNERYTGKFFRRLYRNEETGYGICLYTNGGDTTAVIGTDLPEVNYPITFAGRWVNHKEHGLQFEADIVIEQIPTQPADIISFISNAHVGIGKRKAKMMLDLVGANGFWDIVVDDPDRFSSVITKNRLQRLMDKVSESMFMQNFAKACGSDLKIDTVRYKRISSVFRNELKDLPEMILEDPFILVRAGLSFPELDDFAVKRTRLMANDDRRLLGACLYVLLEGQSKCHSALPHEMVVEKMDNLLRKQGRIAQEEICSFLLRAVVNETIAYEDGQYYLNRSFQEESCLVNVLSELNALPEDSIDAALFQGFLADYEKEHGFQLSPDQKNAVWTAMTRSVCVITGGPGTGKSTILDAIRACWQTFHPGDRCMLLAPTGRAAVRMTEVTGEPASTIHSTLQLIIGSTSFEEMDDVGMTVESELVIVDESSMVDQSTAAALVRSLKGRYIKKRQHLILVGDPDQLPSVAYGNVLADIIISNVVPVCSLSTVYRQAADNPIVTNSSRIKAGETALLWNPTFRGYHNGSEAANKSAVCRFYCACVQKYGIENVILLSPYHGKTGICTNALNKDLQDALNPDVGQPFLPFGKKKFRLGDRVMMLKNTETLNNGDVGIVKDVVQTTSDDDEVHLTVEFENGVVQDFPKENLFQLDLAYALTVHKSQGGQYRVVIMILPDTASPFLQRNVVYTGITRSKEYFAIFGPPEVLSYAIRNDKYGKRYTGLATRLQNTHQKNLKAA